jgi:hypothetical protein
MGRTHQFRISRKPSLPLLVLPTALIVLFIILVINWSFGPVAAIDVVIGGYLTIALLHASTTRSSSPQQLTLLGTILAAILGPLIPFTYAFGQLLGWVMGGTGDEKAPIRLVDQDNQPYVRNEIAYNVLKR